MTRAELLTEAKPMLFNTEMVRAILDGRKTVTRRVIKPQPKNRIAYCLGGYKCRTWGYPSQDAYKYWGEEFKRTEQLTAEEENRYWTPPCHTDDVLYVRETFSEVETVDGKPYYIYKADDNGAYYNHMYSSRENFEKWHPSIHMPKEAARIFLRVTGVGVERLQDITEDGVCEEGAEPLISCKSEHTVYYPEGGMEACFNTGCCSYCPALEETYAELFGKLVWNKTIKSIDKDIYGWDANPWVWVIEFERVEVQE